MSWANIGQTLDPSEWFGAGPSERRAAGYADHLGRETPSAWYQGSRNEVATLETLAECGFGFDEAGEPTRSHPLTGELYDPFPVGVDPDVLANTHPEPEPTRSLKPGKRKAATNAWGQPISEIRANLRAFHKLARIEREHDWDHGRWRYVCSCGNHGQWQESGIPAPEPGATDFPAHEQHIARLVTKSVRRSYGQPANPVQRRKPEPRPDPDVPAPWHFTSHVHPDDWNAGA